MWESTLGWLAAGAGLLAAVLWLVASLAKVQRQGDAKSGEGGLMWRERGKVYSVGPTFLKANRWNAWAAGVTAGAALFQAAALIAHKFCA